MRHCVLFLLIMMSAGSLASSASGGDDKARIEELRKEITSKRAELAKLESELAKLEPLKQVDYLWPNEMKVNTFGAFGEVSQLKNGRLVYSLGTLKVAKVVDGKRMLITVVPGRGIIPLGEPIQILVNNFDTAEIVDGKIINPSPIFKVTGTETLDGKKYFAVEPYTPPKQ